MTAQSHCEQPRREQPHRDRIEPLAAGDGPCWSVMIPCYNNGAHLERAMTSVLQQALPPEQMQIEVVDDCSTEDDPEALVRAVGRGRVGFYRQPVNLGVARNLSACIARAKGRIVHLLHADDFVLPGFYERLGAAFQQAPEIGFAFSRYNYVDAEGMVQGVSPLEQDEAGLLGDHLRRLASEQRICAPSIAVRRAAYERLGAFDYRLRCTEDWEMWVRIAAAYPVWYEPAILACYRMHESGNTGQNLASGNDMAFTGLAIEIFQDYLPEDMARQVARQARETYACSALDMADRMWRAGEDETARAQLAVAFRLRSSPRVIARFLRLFAGALFDRMAGRQGRETT